MSRTVSDNKNTSLASTITLITLVTIAVLLTGCLSQSSLRVNNETIVNQVPNQLSLPVRVTDINETDSLNVTNSYSNYSSAPIKTDPISLGTSNSTRFKQADLEGFFFSLRHNTDQDQIAGSDVTVWISDINEAPVSLDESNFVTYTYGGYPVQQPDSTQFIFSFPDNTSQSQIAGSDALTWNAYAIQKIDFDAAFIAPKIGALGFDEMVIFATSDTNTYKGTEFGIRLDLSIGCIYGYIQEPNGVYGEVNFQMLALMPNDGTMHHYTLFLLDSGVSFCIDGVGYGYLNFPSNTDYSTLSFSICATVHRFTDYWDSDGDNMVAGNFFLNQQ